VTLHEQGQLVERALDRLQVAFRATNTARRDLLMAERYDAADKAKSLLESLDRVSDLAGES